MIYYVGYYKSNSIDDFKKSGSNAASFKMGYVIRLVKSLEEKITIVSWCPSDRYGITKKREIQVGENQKEVYLPTVKIKKMPMRITAKFRNRALYKYLIKNVKKDDTVIVYHAPSISNAIMKAKKKIEFNLILEVEEIYSVNPKILNAEKSRKIEEKIINAADSYIIVNDLIYDKYINNGKPYMVLYGVYDGCVLKENASNTNSNIQLLFSGSIDKVRGVGLAVEIAKHLNGNYQLNICGAGNSKDKEDLLQSIEKHNKAKQGCEIVYHGELSESQLKDLVLSCDIGLNLQDVSNPFEAVSFPSKITFYLQHGLSVVSTKMSSVINSKLANSVFFIDEKPKEIAEQIMNLKPNNKQFNISVMKELDEQAKKNLKNLLV